MRVIHEKRKCAPTIGIGKDCAFHFDETLIAGKDTPDAKNERDANCVFQHWHGPLGYSSRLLQFLNLLTLYHIIY